MKYTEIDTWEAVCQVLGRDPNALPDLSMLPEDFQAYALAAIRIPFAVEAINGLDDEGKRWLPDFTNWSEKKYCVWPDILADKERPSGFGFTYTSTDWTITYTTVGVRLTFRDDPRAMHCFSKFNSWFKDLLLITPEK